LPNYLHGRIDPGERFRERRREARRRKRRRRAAAVVVLLAAGTGIALGATFIGRGSPQAQSLTPAAAAAKAPVAGQPGFVPREIRGVHVTMGLASIPGRLGEYLRLRAFGLNTIELDVKDENGRVGFVGGAPATAVRLGAARPYYSVRQAARAVHAAGLYLIGRVVVYEDPLLTSARPELAIQRSDGSVWQTTAGLGWSNPYDRRVWAYNVGVAAAAARAGFDEIQFDYVRFPSDGDLSAMVFPGRRAEPKGKTIERFLAYAAGRLHPLGVRVSADVFGLAAKRDLGVGQVPQRISRHVDTLYPMVYPSHYSKGEYDITDPDLFPGRTVTSSLVDFRRAVKGRASIVPWLQDFSIQHAYGQLEVDDQVAAARRQHAAGFMLWNPEGVYTKEALSGPSG
jgi:hypothetical protein